MTSVLGGVKDVERDGTWREELLGGCPSPSCEGRRVRARLGNACPFSGGNVGAADVSGLCRGSATDEGCGEGEAPSEMGSRERENVEVEALALYGDEGPEAGMSCS